MYGMNRGGPRGFGGPGMGRGMGGMHHGPMGGPMHHPMMGPRMYHHRPMFGPMMMGGLFGDMFGRRRRGSFFNGIIPGLVIGLLAYFFFF